MSYRLYQSNVAVLTTRGYTELEVLDEEDDLISFDPCTGKFSVFPVRGVIRNPSENTGFRVTTRDISLSTILPKETLVYCNKGKESSFIPIRTVSHTTKLISVVTLPEELLTVVPFDGILEIWNEVYRVPINQIRKAYDDGTRLLGVTPLVLYNQLGKEDKSKFFRGLLKTTEEEKDRLAELMLKHKSTIKSSLCISYEFRCPADGFNFRSLFSHKYRTNVLMDVRGKVKIVKVHVKKNKPLPSNGCPYIPTELRHNYCKNLKDTEVLLDTEAPTLVVNTYIVKK